MEIFKSFMLKMFSVSSNPLFRNVDQKLPYLISVLLLSMGFFVYFSSRWFNLDKVMDGRGVGLSRMFQREGVGVGVVSERGCSWVMLDFLGGYLGCS